MPAKTLRTRRTKDGESARYRFVVGISVSVLEEALNRIARDEPHLKLNQIIYAPGTGYVAIMERLESIEIGEHVEKTDVVPEKEVESTGEPERPRRSTRRNRDMDT